MQDDFRALHAHTPSLSVMDPRGLIIRSVGWYRTVVDQDPSPRTERFEFDVAGRKAYQSDARLSTATQTSPNLSNLHSLSGQVLEQVSVDSGWQVGLPGEAGQMVEEWDGRGIRRRVEYDSMLRPLAIFESENHDEKCTERLTYGTTSNAFANQCGQLIRHDDPSGVLGNLSFNLTGEVVEQSRRFLNDLDLPDWPLLIEERDDLLELAEAESTWRFGPLGDVLEQTDAKGNMQSFAQTVAGQLRASNLQLQGQAAHTLICDIQYDAQGRINAETAGNGVVTALDYDPVDGRLIRLRAGDAHLQDLNYAYDPVGNVVSIEDRAQPTRHFANQQIDPLRTFAYDTLYQLIEANGYEAAAINHGPGEDRFQVFPTANERSNYTQRYEYDAGGNLQTLVHVGTQNHTRSFATSQISNRSLLQTADQPPGEEQITAGFDAAGNLRELQPGQALAWDLRNQLSQVTPVERESATNDSEVYRYDAAGMRARKVRTSQARTVTHLEEVRYLPGLEIRSNTATGQELHVVTVTAGHSNVRVLHWQSAPPANVANDQIRYSLTDHLGSGTLELDADAQLISQEVYYPYGETAWFAGRSEVEAKYKTVRYSGKERDATGLYYYGLRYYAPWLMRWINPDPAGEADGMNLYRFVRNNPVRFEDILGMWPRDSFEKEVDTTRKKAIKAMEKVLKTLKNDADGSVNKVMKRFFGSFDAELKQQWELDIRKTLVVAKATQPINFDLSASADNTKAHVVAEVDMKQFADFARFMTATKRASKSSTQSGIINREQAEVRKDYKDEMETRFLKVVQSNWEKTRKKTSASFMANILIHEFSHAAVDTKDFAYGKAKEGVDPTPLFELTTEATEVSTAGSDFKQSVGMKPVTRAYQNADSFAGAIVFLKRAKSRKTSERALYRLYVESH